MKVNSDINILGGLPDFNLVPYFLNRDESELSSNEPYHTYTSIKTDKSVKRFEKAINNTFLKFNSNESKFLIESILTTESISQDSLLMLFWNASLNNELLHYVNSKVYFPAFYSGRLVIKKEEVTACIKELKETDRIVQGWTLVTIETVARKYLTLMKKFNLMEGSSNKTIVHPYLNDKMFVYFIYWLKSVELKANLLESDRLNYAFSERQVFIERLLQKKFSKYFNFLFTGDKLKIETLIPYTSIYDALN